MEEKKRKIVWFGKEMPEYLFTPPDEIRFDTYMDINRHVYKKFKK